MMMRSMRRIRSDSVPALDSESDPVSPLSQKTFEDEQVTLWPADAPTWEKDVPKKEPSIPEFVPKVRVSGPNGMRRGRSRQRARPCRMARSMSPSVLSRSAKPFIPGTPSSSVSPDERSSGSSIKAKLDIPRRRARGISVDAAEFVPRSANLSLCASPRSPALAPVAPHSIAPVALAAPENVEEGGEGVAGEAREVNPLNLDFGAMNGEYNCGRMTGIIDGFTMNMTAPSGKKFIYHLCVGKVDGKPMIEARVGGKRGIATYCINSVRIEAGGVQPSKLFWSDLRPHKNRQPYVWEAVVQEVEPEGEEDHQEAEDVHVGLWVPEIHAPQPHVGLWVPELHHDAPAVDGEGEAHHEIDEQHCIEGSPEGSEEEGGCEPIEGQLEGEMGLLA